MNFRLFSVSILLLASTLFSACIDPNEIIEDQFGDASLTATINGEDFSASGLLITAEYSEQTGVKTLGIVGAELPLGGDTRTITLALVSTDSTDLQVGDVYTASSIEKAGGGEYSLEDDTQKIKASSDTDGFVGIAITAIDLDKKVISGTFAFDGEDSNDPGTIYEVREGVFIDISFE
jgi:hypothetical protein